MTRAMNLSWPIACSQCGERFTRTRGNQRRCEKCKALIRKLPGIIAAADARAAAEAGTDCRYPACGHILLKERIVDLASGTCKSPW
jgi:hypothetical protein